MLSRVRRRVLPPALSYLLLVTSLWLASFSLASRYDAFATTDQLLVALVLAVPALLLFGFVVLRFVYRELVVEVRAELQADLGSPYWVPEDGRAALVLHRRLQRSDGESREILSTLLADADPHAPNLSVLELLSTAENLSGASR